MVCWRSAGAALLVLLGVAGDARAAPPAAWELGMTHWGGWADNVLATPAEDAVTAETASALYGLELGAALLVPLGAGLEASARYDGSSDFYTAAAAGSWHIHRGRLELAWASGAWRADAALGGSGYASEPYPEERFGAVDGALGASWSNAWLSARVAGVVRGRFFVLESSTLGQRREDVELGAVARVTVSPLAGLWAIAGYHPFDRDSNEPAVDRLYHRVFVGAGWSGRGVSARVDYGVTVRDADAGSDVFHGLEVGLDYELLDWLDLRARYRFGGDETAAGDQAFRAHRVDVGVGLRFGGLIDGGAGSRPGVQVAAFRQGVVLRLCQPGAQRAALIGAFDGWSEEGHRLAGPDERGCFEGLLPLAPGRYEVQLVVDGERVVPAGFALTVDDGFGGRNAVLFVE